MIKTKLFNSHLLEDEYYSPFEENNADGKKKRIAALERAWQNRDFEIDKYWSRAAYFWAFIASAFAGYISTANSDNLKKFPELPFIIICLGLVFSVAWLLVNIGSKKWQENWEKHIDMLEDEVTGPLYKTVLNKTSYSVSNINIYVSLFIIIAWMGLTIISLVKTGFNLIMILSLFVTLLFILLLLFLAKTKSGEKRKSYSFSRRLNDYE